MGGLCSKTKTVALILVLFTSTVSSIGISSLSHGSLFPSASLSETFTEKHIIICDSQFYIAAHALEVFHDAQNISTAVVNSSWIASVFSTSEDPNFKGYGQNRLARLFISKEYDYILAKKIVSFLRNTSMHPNLEYVTLFGDGNFIPPSYYVYTPMRYAKSVLGMSLIPDFYNNRIATDFFYTSPDYDTWPDFKVGRIPVTDVNQAAAYVEKIQEWSEQATWDWFQNVYVAGDQPDHPEEMDLDGCFAGEMIATDAINLNVFQGMNVNKLFLTENTFTRSAIVNTLNTGQAGFLYVMAHGGVDRWGTYQETNPYITSDDVLACPENLHLPIVVSVACMAGASDTSLARPYWIKKGQTSFGEAVLFSAGAGIAYVGTTRATLGSPELYLDNGEVVITKERGIAGMLTYFFEAYHNNITTLGDITYSALETYVTKNMFSANPEKDEAFVVLVSFTLLGDPALQLPVPQPQTRPSYSVPHLIALDYEGITSETNPRPWYYTNTTISIQITTDSPEIVVKRINIDNDLVVDRQTLAVENNSVVYSFTSGQPARYLIRASSQDGKEGWLYCTASP